MVSKKARKNRKRIRAFRLKIIQYKRVCVKENSTIIIDHHQSIMVTLFLYCSYHVFHFWKRQPNGRAFYQVRGQYSDR